MMFLVGLALIAAALPADPAVDRDIPPLTTNASALALWAAQNADDSARAGGPGAAFMPNALGLYVLAVARNSPAERAGLGGGEIVERVNAMPLRGLTARQMLTLVRGGGPTITLGLLDKGEVKLVLPAKR
jgi:S1-C subfamily serine protease